MSGEKNVDKAVLMVAFARMDVVALAVALGSVAGLLLFAATVTLLLKGAPAGGHIGPNLGTLGIYLPGYSVTWGGSIFGAVYGWLVGATIGFFAATLWNLTHYLYVTLAALRALWWQMMAD